MKKNKKLMFSDGLQFEMRKCTVNDLRTALEEYHSSKSGYQNYVDLCMHVFNKVVFVKGREMNFVEMRSLPIEDFFMLTKLFKKMNPKSEKFIGI